MKVDKKRPSALFAPEWVLEELYARDKNLPSPSLREHSPQDTGLCPSGSRPLSGPMPDWVSQELTRRRHQLSANNSEPLTLISTPQDVNA